MLRDLAAGAVLVIAEGRESGTVGLFDAAGEVHKDLVEAILRAVGHETVIFEAPTARAAGVAAAATSAPMSISATSGPRT
jgi:phosphosulfolactate synthase (CoM biosynthesis protein A)